METRISGRLRVSRIVSLVILLLGVSLMAYMIKVEGELGALPLLLVIAGAVWFVTTHYKIKKQLR